MSESDIVAHAKEHLMLLARDGESKFAYLPRHLQQVERWAGKLLQKYPEAMGEVVLAAVWLHDTGLLTGPAETDHAVNSENEVRRYLPTVGADEDFIDRVARCVRSHRCRDVQPERLEERILAASDSASHMTDTVYIDFANRGEKSDALAKLERDLRDVSIFPELADEIMPLYDAWKNLLLVYPDAKTSTNL